MKVAIVGTGIAGLSAANELYHAADVTLFEEASRPGGHTYTVPVEDGGGRLAIDMGFIVYNERTYPRFTRLLSELGVETEPSSMSFSVSCERTGLEYCGSSLRQLFVQKRNLFSPSFYRMLLGILRFHRAVPALLEADPALSLGAYLEQARYPRPFVDHYLLPMCSAIWSTTTGDLRDFPLRSLARFLDNHGMATVDDRPVWRVVKGGSQRYLDRLLARFGDRVRVGCGVRRVERRSGGVELELADGERARFDAVLLACHSDQALALLGDPTSAEHEVLGALPYADNVATLHTDRRFLPRHKGAWSSWNYHLGAGTAAKTQLTYWMNELQNLRSDTPYCVTLNRADEIDPAQVLHQCVFAHPQFTTGSLRAQERWAELNDDRTFFAGAYWFYGFHEDGVRSGQRAAGALLEALCLKAAA